MATKNKETRQITTKSGRRIVLRRTTKEKKIREYLDAPDITLDEKKIIVAKYRELLPSVKRDTQQAVSGSQKSADSAKEQANQVKKDSQDTQNGLDSLDPRTPMPEKLSRTQNGAEHTKETEKVSRTHTEKVSQNHTITHEKPPENVVPILPDSPAEPTAMPILAKPKWQKSDLKPHSLFYLNEYAQMTPAQLEFYKTARQHTIAEQTAIDLLEQVISPDKTVQKTAQNIYWSLQKNILTAMRSERASQPRATGEQSILDKIIDGIEISAGEDESEVSPPAPAIPENINTQPPAEAESDSGLESLGKNNTATQ